MPDAVLALNAGSSSIKFALYECQAAGPSLVSRGLLDDGADRPHLTVRGPDGATLLDRSWDGTATHGELLRALLDWIEGHLGQDRLIAAGHRIVHGGRDFTEPTLLTPESLRAVEALTPLAPLHQPRSLAPIKALRALRPDLAQVGCFDTGFHHRLAPPVSRYAVPRRYEEEGVRRYGFHGLSYAFVAGRLREIAPELAAKRTVVAHLGNGASLCAMRDGRSLDTTMGFTALDGLVMGTRPGALDPGIVLYLQQSTGMSAADIEHMLYHRSGLLGVSGVSADMRTLLASTDPKAKEAVDLFAFSIARHTAAMANTLEGLELFVFTGGIGEHAPEIRRMVCDRLRWLGVACDPAANEAGAEIIGRPGSRVEVRVIPTDEELVIARGVLAVAPAGEVTVSRPVSATPRS